MRRRWSAMRTSQCTSAKRNKTGFAIYDPHYDTSQQEHLSLLSELRRAVERTSCASTTSPKFR